jgi:hypothetical protein
MRTDPLSEADRRLNPAVIAARISVRVAELRTLAARTRGRVLILA